MQENADKNTTEETTRDGNLEGSDEDLTVLLKIKYFFINHWRGLCSVITPLITILCLMPYPPQKFQWCAYTLLVMAVFWVTECIALPVTSFIPVIIFPISGIMDTYDVCISYINNTIFMFLGSLFLAAAVEQSGLHVRLALATIRCIGYSHLRLLLALCVVTMFVSMWIVNTAATSMMVPINFALLEVFEESKLLSIYDVDQNGERSASDLATLYFCATTYSATIGGIGTLIGTGTNLVFKGLLQTTYPAAPDYLTFINFSAFAIPYMLLMELSLFLCLAVMYLGLFRPKSAAAKRATLTPEAMKAAKEAVEKKWKELGPVTYWEINVIVLFSGCMILFFCRSPQIFIGWGDRIQNHFGVTDKFIGDSVLALLVSFVMWLLPSTLVIFKNFTADINDLPKGKIVSVLNWNNLNNTMPWGFMFLLGGGFALSKGAGQEYSDLNGKIGEALVSFKNLPNGAILLLIIIFTVFITNFASNIAVCNVVTPIAMRMAQEIGQNPLWYNIASGFSASYCFMLPVGTPGNLLVQSAANIPTGKMVKAGALPTLIIIALTWFLMYFWAPVIWPDLKLVPDWINPDKNITYLL